FLNHSSTRPPGRRWKRIDAVCLAAAGWPAATAPGLVGSAGIGPLVVAGAVLTAGVGALVGVTVVVDTPARCAGSAVFAGTGVAVGVGAPQAENRSEAAPVPSPTTKRRRVTLAMDNSLLVQAHACSAAFLTQENSVPT